MRQGRDKGTRRAVSLLYVSDVRLHHKSHVVVKYDTAVQLSHNTTCEAGKVLCKTELHALISDNEVRA